MPDDVLKKIKELLEIVGNKVDKLETHVSLHSATMHRIKDQQSVINEKLDEIQETLESHSGSLVSIESVLNGYADMYKINKSEIEKIKKHVGLPVTSD